VQCPASWGSEVAELGEKLQRIDLIWEKLGRDCSR